jgi:hypothetical protein
VQPATRAISLTEVSFKPTLTKTCFAASRISVRLKALTAIRRFSLLSSDDLGMERSHLAFASCNIDIIK